MSAASALLLRDRHQVRFVPARNFYSLATLTYHAWDQTRGSAGGRRLDGGERPRRLEPVQHGRGNGRRDGDFRERCAGAEHQGEPGAHASGSGATDPTGTTVASLLGTVATDVDGDTIGIAVTGVTGTGTWQRQVGGSGSWIDLTPVTVQNPALFGSTDQVRFVPAVGFNGIAKLTYKAWDGSAVSQATESASLLVNSVDDRPILDPKGHPVLTPVPVDATNPAGDLVSAFLGNWATDPDPGADLGIAVIGATTQGGTWQVSADGTNWSNLGVVSARAPQLLHGTDHVRFVPAVGFTGVAMLAYRAWDAASSAPHGPAAFSTATETALVAFNNAPVLHV